MMADLGSLLLQLSMFLLILMAVQPIIAKTGIRFSYKVFTILWIIVSAMTFIAFLSLIYCYIQSDFSVLNVANNSHTAKPLIYKIAGVWGNHEGSMLLWVNAVNFSTLLFIALNHDENFGLKTLSTQSFINAFFMGFTIFASNPFIRLFPPPTEGLSLNPLLQDIGLALHPPCLYLGYVGFSIIYSMTIAALLSKKLNSSFAIIIKRCTAFSMCFLTIGITLGSWWAYRELGWGGFWFWDPVENASLMPWLSGLALLHAVNTYIKTTHMLRLTIVLSMTTFMLSILGMFLVRSGIVTSVHSFASDATKGLYVLCFLSAIFFLAVYVYKAKFQNNDPIEQTRTGMLFTLNLNTLILSVCIFTVALGTIYPMFLEILTGKKISVGAPYFNQIFNPLVILLCLVCTCATTYIKKNQQKHAYSEIIILLLALCSCFVIHTIEKLNFVLSFLGLFSGLCLLLSTLRISLSKHTHAWRSMILGHSGIAIAVIAISLNMAWSTEKTYIMQENDTVLFMKNEITLQKNNYKKIDNYITQQSVLRIFDKRSNTVFFLCPEVRLFYNEQQQTAEPDIYKKIFSDLYIATDGLYVDGKGIRVTVYYRPMMGWLFFSGFLVAFACLCSFFSRAKLILHAAINKPI